MKFHTEYESPLGIIYLQSDGKYLTAVDFDINKISNQSIKSDLPVFNCASRWLDIYFSGKIPDFTPEYKIENSTPFRK